MGLEQVGSQGFVMVCLLGDRCMCDWESCWFLLIRTDGVYGTGCSWDCFTCDPRWVRCSTVVVGVLMG